MLDPADTLCADRDKQICQEPTWRESLYLPSVAQTCLLRVALGERRPPLVPVAARGCV